MIYRTFDSELLTKALEPYPQFVKGFVAEDWLGEYENIALTDDAGNLGLLVYNRPGIYCGHYFFKRKQRETATRVREMIDHAFSHYPIELLIGMTPIANTAARRMNDLMGFSSQGIIKDPLGACEMVSLSRQDFYEKAE